MHIDLEGVYFGRNHYTSYPCALLVISSSSDQPGGELPSAGGREQYLDRKLCGVRCRQAMASLKQQQADAAAITTALASRQKNDTDFMAQLAFAVTNAILEFIGVPPQRIEIIPAPLWAWLPGLRIAFSYDDSLVAEESAGLICDLLRYIAAGDSPETVDDQVTDFTARVYDLQQQCQERLGSLSSAALAAIASARGIPRIRFGQWPLVKPKGMPLESVLSICQLGQGIHQQRLRNALPLPLSPKTEALLQDRVALNRHLDRAGIRVPPIEHEYPNITLASRALRAADRLGYPVVLKTPGATAGSRTVPGLNDAEALTAAFEQLHGENRRLVLEKYISGEVFRCLVFGGEVQAACRRQPFEIVGDGLHTVFELLWDEPGDEQAAKHRNAHFQAFKQRLENALELQGLDFESVLPDGEVVRLQEGAEPLATGPVEDVLSQLQSFPQILDLARDAANCLELKAAAIEIAIAQSDGEYKQDSATVVALDPDPDLAFHRQQGEFLPLQAATLYLDALLPTESDLRIPIATVTGTNGKTTTCFMLDNILRAAGRATGLACSDGLYIQGQRQKKGILSGISGGIQVFTKSNVDTAVLETSRGTLLEKGLVFDRCDVAACLNIASDHLGEDGVETLEQLAVVKGTVISSARQAVVLNGEDKHCLAMLEHCAAERIYLVYSGDSPAEFPPVPGPRHYAICIRAEGSRQRIMLCDSKGDTPIIDVAEIPATWNGTAHHNVQNAMFAIAMALGMNIEPRVIKSALADFDTSIDVTPGRMNLFDALPFKVLIDYAHNAHGYEALCQCTRHLDVPGKRILIIFSPERQDPVEKAAIAAAVVGQFDRFICRGRHQKITNTEVDPSPSTLREALITAGVPKAAVAVIHDVNEAVESALIGANEGDLIVVSATGRYRWIWDQLLAFQEGKLLGDMAEGEYSIG